jgi:hypothetical protein
MFGWGKKKACDACRQVIYSASYDWKALPQNVKRHALVYRCDDCGTYWEIGERAAWPISDAEAAELLRDAAPPG